MQQRLVTYDTRAGDWWSERGVFSRLADLTGPRFEFFDRHLTNWTGLDVLVVGCGGGYVTEHLVRRGCSVWGVDGSPESVRVAAEHAVAEGMAIDYRVAAPTELPFDDRKFDVVLCLDLLEHVDDASAVVGEIARVLQPGGHFLFGTHNRTWLSRVVVWWERMRGDLPSHDWSRFLKPGELRKLLASHGLMDVSLAGMGPREPFPRKRDGGARLELGGSLQTTYLGTCRAPPGPPAV